MARLPDDALVVHGGMNLPENFAQGNGVTQDPSGKLQGVSVNAGLGASVEQLTAPNAQGYIGIPNGRVGYTTVGQIRRLGGDVVPDEQSFNPHHATLAGLTPEQASALFARNLVKNPNAAKRK